MTGGEAIRRPPVYDDAMVSGPLRSGLERLAVIALCGAIPACLLDDSPFPGAAGATSGASSTGGSTGGATTGGAGGGMSTTTSGGAGGGGTGVCAACKSAGGMCDEKKDKCVFACDGSGACADLVVCPAGLDCEVDCKGQDTCAGGVDCSAAVGCDVTCSGDRSCGGSAPNRPSFKCGSGTCAFHCTGGPSCVADFGCTSSACTINCGGNANGVCAAVACTGDCTIDCSAASSCASLKCSEGSCKIGCTGDGSCKGVDCIAACACQLTCDPSACEYDPLCPLDVQNTGPCSTTSPEGCTPIGGSCDKCN